MRVRNAKACQVSLSRFGKLPTGEVLLFETETVAIAPGETLDVEDEFFESDGAKGFLADGTLVDVVAEAERVSEAANALTAGGEPEPAKTAPTPEPAPEPAKRSKSKGD